MIQLPKSIGVGYKSKHRGDILKDTAQIGWLEIHAENYMGDGGRPIAELKELSEIYPISCHGVGLSIGAESGLDPAHLDRLKHLIAWLKPAQFSEHLAWSTHGAQFLNDLLPLPYTEEVLARVSDHINQVQDILGQRMLLENPSLYIQFTQSQMPETEFIARIVENTGCGLLLDVNNVFISATNQGYSARGYIDAYPLDHIGELHLGGHEEDTDDDGDTLLIDSHSRAVVDPVWALYDYVLSKTGPRPTLIEWDNDIPDWSVLAHDAHAAKAIMDRHGRVAAE
ncbi:MAG: DUF692 domain-containing protein [Pseudomonadota bacterium]